MRILQVIPYFVPAWDYGGPVSSAYNLSKELAKRGHSVTVYTTDTLNSGERIKKNEEIIDGIKVKRFKNWSNSIASKHKIFLSQSMVSSLRNTLKEFDIVHMHEYRTLENIIVHRYAQKYNIPFVVQPGGSLPRIMAKRGLKRLYDVLWGYRILRDASKAIAVTMTEAEQYKSMGVSGDKIEIVPHGIDLAEFDNLPERREFRRKYGLNDNQRIILYLGRIHKIKGLDLLVKAFADVSKSLNDVKLIIVGPDDGYLPSLKKLIADLEISDKILFTGHLYGEDKVETYVGADVFVLPSVYEIFGITVLEALACGTPVIITNRCGLADVINGQTGLVVPYDKDHLRDGLLHMLGEDKKRQEFGGKGKLLVREKFNWQKIAEQMETIYAKCKNPNSYRGNGQAK